MEMAVDREEMVKDREEMAEDREEEEDAKVAWTPNTLWITIIKSSCTKAWRMTTVAQACAMQVYSITVPTCTKEFQLRRASKNSRTMYRIKLNLLPPLQ